VGTSVSFPWWKGGRKCSTFYDFFFFFLLTVWVFDYVVLLDQKSLQFSFEFRVPVGARIFSSLHRPDRLQDTSNHISYLSQRVKQQGHEADNSLQLVPKSRKRGHTSTPPICLHGVVLNYLSKGTTLP
jgi:hypothetical protein